MLKEDGVPMRSFFALFSIVAVLISITFVFAGCSNTETEESLPPYTGVMDKIEAHLSSLNEYRNANNPADSIRTVEAVTPAQNTCSVTKRVYDGGRFTNYELIANRDGVEQHDEYYVIDSSTIFIARAYRTDVSYIFKYVVIDGVMYEINDEEDTLVLVEKPDSTDLFLAPQELDALFE